MKNGDIFSNVLFLSVGSMGKTGQLVVAYGPGNKFSVFNVDRDWFLSFPFPQIFTNDLKISVYAQPLMLLVLILLFLMPLCS